MDAVLETTKWEDKTPNHTYLLQGDKMVAYIKAGTTEPFYFSKPLGFDKRGRTFVKADASLFTKVKPNPELVEVKGSKGETYYVNPTAKTCTCPGFKFRGTCKHIS